MLPSVLYLLICWIKQFSSFYYNFFLITCFQNDIRHEEETRKEGCGVLYPFWGSATGIFCTHHRFEISSLFWQFLTFLFEVPRCFRKSTHSVRIKSSRWSWFSMHLLNGLVSSEGSFLPQLPGKCLQLSIFLSKSIEWQVIRGGVYLQPATWAASRRW